MADDGKYIKALESRPVLLPGLDFYFQAYNDLIFDRPIGMTIGLIPWSSITKWCELHEVCDINDIATCIRYIRKMEQFDHDLKEGETE